MTGDWHRTHTPPNAGRILIVDDDFDLAESLLEVLRDHGHMVEMATDAGK